MSEFFGVQSLMVELRPKIAEHIRSECAAMNRCGQEMRMFGKGTGYYLRWQGTFRRCNPTFLPAKYPWLYQDLSIECRPWHHAPNRIEIINLTSIKIDSSSNTDRLACRSASDWVGTRNKLIRASPHFDSLPEMISTRIQHGIRRSLTLWTVSHDPCFCPAHKSNPIEDDG